MTRDWDRRADELAARAIADGEPTAWFDRLYAEGVAGRVSMPWDRTDPHPLLAEWAERRDLDGAGRRAVVVGCGLGADAAYVARLGFRTTGFDVAPAAVEQARSRFDELPVDAPVDFRVADLLALDDDLLGAFDLVVEIFTLQALPPDVRPAAAAGVRSLLAPRATLLAVAHRGDHAAEVTGPPWPQSRDDMTTLAAVGAADGLTVVALEEAPGELWRAEYRRG